MAQLDLVSLFSEFEVRSLNDYKLLELRKKSSFNIRLFKVLTNDKTKTKLLNHFKNDDGIKFHYNCVPNEYDDKEINTFLKKISFFSHKTLITFPLSGRKLRKRELEDIENLNDEEEKIILGQVEIDSRKDTGFDVKAHKDKAIIVPKNEFEFIIKTISNSLNVLQESKNIFFFTGLSSEVKKIISPSMNLISANFNMNSLKTQFYEFSNDIIDENEPCITLLLPRFTNVPENQIIQVREEEKRLYEKFILDLEKVIASTQNIEKDLLFHLKEINNEVNDLTSKFEEIEKVFKKKNILGFISLSFTLFGIVIPWSFAPILSQIVGGISIKQIWDSYSAKKQDIKKLEEETMYLMYRINSLDKKK